MTYGDIISNEVHYRLVTELASLAQLQIKCKERCKWSLLGCKLLHNDVKTAGVTKTDQCGIVITANALYLVISITIELSIIPPLIF